MHMKLLFRYSYNTSTIPTSQVLLLWSVTWNITLHWPMMSLPIRYPPMAFHFRLSIVFLTPQDLRHLPRWCNLLWPSRKPSCDHHPLYPIPIAPSVRYHIGDLSYDLQTTLLCFPFLVSSLLPDAFFRGPTNHRSSHCAIGTLPYTSPHTNLVLVLLIVWI